MRAWIRYVLLLYAAVLIGVALTALLQGIPEKPTRKVPWSEDAIDYFDNYVGSPAGFCILRKSGMPAGPIPKAAALIECASEKFANMTDNMVDLLDLRAIEVTYMIDEGRLAGGYADGCAAVSDWEDACDVPYEIDCSEVVAFVEANHNDISAAIDKCSD